MVPNTRRIRKERKNNGGAKGKLKLKLKLNLKNMSSKKILTVFLVVIVAAGVIGFGFSVAAKRRAAKKYIKEPPAAKNVSPKPAFDKFSLWTSGTKLRGADVHQRQVYPGIYDDEAWGQGPYGPVFTQADFDALRDAGANYVVLSHPGLYDVERPYAFDKNAQDNLDKFVDMADKAKLYAVIAVRTGPGRSEFGFFGDNSNDEFAKSHLNDEVWKSQAAQDKWVEMWKYMAARYKNRPNVVGYDLMVEPNSNAVWFDQYDPEAFYASYANTTYDWNQFYPRIVKAIREVDKDTPILIGSLSWSQVSWLPYMRRVEYPRVVYAVHQYEPQNQYTHQMADASGNFPNGYPGQLNIDGAPTDFDAAWIDNLLGIVDVWKKKTGAPVAVTEYGAKRWEPNADKFLDDEMARFEKSGVNYAIWSWQPFSPQYSAEQNEFNFRIGPDPAVTSEGGSKIFDVLKSYWKKNAARPQ